MTVELCKSVKGAPIAHLDAALFEEALEYALQECAAITLVKITIDLGSSTGDNFLGLIYRAQLQYRRAGHANEFKSVIVKCIPYTQANDFLLDCNVFLKEKTFYRAILPSLEILSKEFEKFGAKLYHTLKEPINTLIFEDLTTRGFTLASRETGLDEVHCNVVLKKLGKFHAMSMLLQEKDPELMQCFHSGLISPAVLKDNGVPLRYYGAQLQALESVLSTWHGYEKIAAKINEYRQHLRDNLLKCVALKSHDLKVLNHGDLWVNNVLFQYEHHNGEHLPAEAIFVDFQMSMWSSPGIDLNYFFNTSVQLEVLQMRRAHLLRVYYESLSETLAAHDYARPPSYEQLQLEVQRRESFGFFAAFAIFPLISLDKQAAGDNNLDNLADEDFARRKIEMMYAMPRVQSVLRYSLKRFEQLGVFD